MRSLVIISLFSVLASASLAPAEVMYVVTDLGALDVSHSSSGARAINNHGQIIGSSVNAVDRGFIYQDGLMSDLGTIGGATTFAYSINNPGQVVGWSRTMDIYGQGYGPEHAFLWSAGSMSDLGIGGYQSTAEHINDSGTVVGKVRPSSDSDDTAFVYSNGAVFDLGAAMGASFSEATAVNNNGVVVGHFTNPTTGQQFRGFLWDGSNWRDIGTLGGQMTVVDDINDAGWVVGRSCTDNSYSFQAFLYRDGEMHNLGTLGDYFSEATAINNTGQAVGYCYGGTTILPVLFQDGQAFDLNTLIDPSTGWQLKQAGGINDYGQIVGGGYNSAGENHAFLLTPIPEPATFSLLAVGAFILSLARSKGRHHGGSRE